MFHNKRFTDSPIVLYWGQTKVQDINEMVTFCITVSVQYSIKHSISVSSPSKAAGTDSRSPSRPLKSTYCTAHTIKAINRSEYLWEAFRKGGASFSEDETWSMEIIHAWCLVPLLSILILFEVKNNESSCCGPAAGMWLHWLVCVQCRPALQHWRGNLLSRLAWPAITAWDLAIKHRVTAYGAVPGRFSQSRCCKCMNVEGVVS